MRKNYLLCKLGVLALFAVAFQSCKKENGIDNDTVIKKPYGMYIGDNLGALYNTNTGDSLKLVFPPDGFSPRSIVTSGMNILWVKYNTHLSEDNGLNFNPTDLTVLKGLPWQPIMLNVDDQNRVYLVSSDPNGIILSDDHGKHWTSDTMWDAGITDRLVTSLVETKNKTMYAHNFVTNKLYKRISKTSPWTEVAVVTSLPTTGAFYLAHINDALLLTDYTGANGVWHSEDGGLNWAQYNGLPATELMSTDAPFDNVVLVGTDSMGVYRLAGGSFVPATGLTQYTSVRAITGKNNIYKNDKEKQYYYLATSTGLYRSEDGGQTWTMTITGNFSAIF